MSEDFARPLADLRDAKIPNTIDPAGGMGLTLDSSGLLPLSTLFVDKTGSPPAARQIAFGTATATWTGIGQTSGTVTVTHGLRTTPAVVVAISTVSSDGKATSTYLQAAPGATTFTVIAYAIPGAPAGSSTATIHWLAIG